MASVEGSSAGRDEVVETDLSLTEGLPSSRGRSVDAGGIATPVPGEAGRQHELKEGEYTHWFRGPSSTDPQGVRISTRRRLRNYQPLSALLPHQTRRPNQAPQTTPEGDDTPSS